VWVIHRSVWEVFCYLKEEKEKRKKMSELVGNSFVTFLKSIETETKVLKCLTNLRSIDANSENIEVLRGLESSLDKLEEDADVLDSMLDAELESLLKFEQLCVLCKQQSAAVAKLPGANNIPTSNFVATSNSAKSTSSKSVSIVVPEQSKQPPSSSTVAPFVRRTDDITAEEFEAVSRTTRGRLTLPVINRINKSLIELLAKKKKEYHLPRSKLTPPMIISVDEYNSKRSVDHGKLPFLTEAELRNSTVFEVSSARLSSICKHEFISCRGL
jgi:hypothetical protein